MARTRWPSDLATPASSQAGQIRPAAPVGARKPGPGRQIVSQDSPSGVSRIGGQAGTQAPTLRPYHHKTAEAGPEALIHILPAESGAAAAANMTGAVAVQKSRFCVLRRSTVFRLILPGRAGY